MSFEVIAALISLLLGGLLPLAKEIAKEILKKSKKKGKLQNILAKTFDIEVEGPESYKQRLNKTLEVLRKAFSEVDKATTEFTNLMKEKENNIEQLEHRLNKLSREETEIKKRVEVLQKVPIEALDHFEKILVKGDKRSALRDYVLFGLGVVVSVIVTLLLRYFEI